LKLTSIAQPAEAAPVALATVEETAPDDQIAAEASDTTGYFESFAETTSNNMKGSLTTPFAGSHGWYWKNETDTPVIVTLSIKGNYIIKP